MEVRGHLQGLQMEPQFPLNGKLVACASPNTFEKTRLLPTAKNRTTIHVIQANAYSPHSLRYARPLSHLKAKLRTMKFFTVWLRTFGIPYGAQPHCKEFHGS